MASVRPFIPVKIRILNDGAYPFLSDDCKVLNLGLCFYDTETGNVLTTEQAYKFRFLNSRNKMSNFFDNIETKSGVELSVHENCLISKQKIDVIDKSASDLHGIVKEICNFLCLYSESKCIATFSSSNKPCFLNENVIFTGDSIFEIDTHTLKLFPEDFSLSVGTIFSVSTDSICYYYNNIFKQYNSDSNTIKDMVFAHYQIVKGFVMMKNKDVIVYTEIETQQTHPNIIKVREKSKQKLIVKNFNTGSIEFEIYLSNFEKSRDIIISKFIGVIDLNAIIPVYTISNGFNQKFSKSIIIGHDIIELDFEPRDIWFDYYTKQVIVYKLDDRTLHFFSIDKQQNCQCTEDCSRKCVCKCHDNTTDTQRSSFTLQEIKVVKLKPF